MAYIGDKPSQTLASPTSQYFNGDGSTVAFTLNRAVNVSEDLEVFVNNIQQEPGVGKSYTATGTTLTFDAAPSAGTANVYVVYRGLAEVTTRLEHDPNAALAATTGTFSGDLTVDTNTLYVDSTNNRVGVGTQSPGSTLEVAGAIQATGNAITVSDSGFNSRLNLFNTGSGGSDFSLYSTMSSFSQGANTFMLYSPSAVNGIIKASVDGRVTMPYQPAFTVYTTASTSAPNTIQFGGVEFNVGGHFNTSTGVFTAPVAGKYWFFWHLLTDRTTNSAEGYVDLYKNSSYWYRNYEYKEGTNNFHVEFKGGVILNLAASDTVYLYFQTSIGGNIIANFNHCKFSGYLLG